MSFSISLYIEESDKALNPVHAECEYVLLQDNQVDCKNIFGNI